MKPLRLLVAFGAIAALAAPFQTRHAFADDAAARPELALQIGHMAMVRCMAVSPDGALLASGGLDRTAKLWDANSGALLRSIPQNSGVLAIAFAPNGAMVTADADGSVNFWDTKSGSLRGRRRPSGEPRLAAALAADGVTIAFARSDGKIVISNIRTGKISQTLDGHPTTVLAMAFSPDGSTLASCSAAVREKPKSEEFARTAGDIRLWDTGDGELIRTLRGHALSVNDVAWSPDGKRLASVGDSGTAVLWDTTSFARLREYNISMGQGRALCVSFSPDGTRLAAGWRGGVQLWDIANEAKPLWAEIDEEPDSSVAFLPGGRIAAGSREGTLQFLGAADGAAGITHSRVSPLVGAVVSPDGNFVAASGLGGDVELWDAAHGTIARAWHAHKTGVRDIAFSPDGKLLATAGADGCVRLWSVPSCKLNFTLPGFNGPVTAIAFSRDGTTLAAGGKHGGTIAVVTLWNVGNGALKATLNDTNAEIWSLSFGANGELAAATARGDAWGQVVVWKQGGAPASREFMHGAHTVAFTADGKRLAAAGSWLDDEEDDIAAGDVVRVWGMRSGEQIREVTAKAPRAHGMALTYDPAGTRLVEGSNDGAIRVWSQSDPTPQVLEGHAGPVRSLAFTPDGKAIVSAGRDGTVRLWDGATGALRVTLIALPTDSAKTNVPIGTPLAPDWIALTPDGYFNGSPGSARFVQWRVGDDVFPIESYSGVYERSAAIDAAMAGQAVALPAAAEFDSGKAIPPSVTITAPRAGSNATAPLSIKLDATDNKNLSSVQLLVNGRAVDTQKVTEAATPVDAGSKAIELGAKAIELGAKPIELGAKSVPDSHNLEWNFNLPVTLPPADGSGLTVKAIVTDGDGLQASDEIRLARDGVTGTQGTLRVLAVGISAYAHTAYNLKYAASDANAFAALWPPQKGRLFTDVSVTTLTDAAANSKAVAAAIENITKVAQPDDVVVIFLSGHGVQKPTGEFYFATQDINVDDLDNTTVGWTAFQNALAGSKARRVVLFLDACHSGSALGGRQAAGESMAEQLVKSAGTVVFTSSLGSQSSFELDDLKHGAFTEALMEGIAGGKADLDAGAGKDGVINVEELLTYIRARVPQLTDGAQIPSCPLLRDFGEPFPLAKTQ